MIAERHYWRTADGRLVHTGHIDAEVLAYPAGSEIPDDVARAAGLLDPPVQAKQAPKPADKARAKPAEK
jgi:hypothetical protein